MPSLLNDFGVQFHRVSEELKPPTFYPKNPNYPYGAINSDFMKFIEKSLKDGETAPEILYGLILEYMTPICDKVAECTNARLNEEYQNVPLDDRKNYNGEDILNYSALKKFQRLFLFFLADFFFAISRLNYDPTEMSKNYAQSEFSKLSHAVHLDPG